MTTTLQSDLTAYLAWIDAEIAKCDVATAGPWDNEGHAWIYAKVPNGRPNGEGIAIFRGDHPTNEQDTRNAALCASAGTHYRRVLEAQRAALEALVTLLSSAAPHPEVSPSMFVAWAKANDALHAILTAWKESQ